MTEFRKKKERKTLIIASWSKIGLAIVAAKSQITQKDSWCALQTHRRPSAVNLPAQRRAKMTECSPAAIKQWSAVLLSRLWASLLLSGGLFTSSRQVSEFHTVTQYTTQQHCGILVYNFMQHRTLPHPVYRMLMSRQGVKVMHGWGKAFWWHTPTRAASHCAPPTGLPADR